MKGMVGNPNINMKKNKYENQENIDNS